MEQLKTIATSLGQAYELNCVVQLTLVDGQRPSGLIAAVEDQSVFLNQQAGVVHQIDIDTIIAIDFLPESWWQR